MELLTVLDSMQLPADVSNAAEADAADDAGHETSGVSAPLNELTVTLPPIELPSLLAAADISAVGTDCRRVLSDWLGRQGDLGAMRELVGQVRSLMFMLLLLLLLTLLLLTLLLALLLVLLLLLLLQLLFLLLLLLMLLLLLTLSLSDRTRWTRRR